MSRPSESLRYAVLRRDGFKCRYCGASAEETKLVVDHVVPDSHGGPTEAANLASACVPCNRGKAATPPDAAFVAELEKDTEAWAVKLRHLGERKDAARDEQRHHHDLFYKAWSSYGDYTGRAYELPVWWRNAIGGYIDRGLTDSDLAELVESVMGRPKVDNRFAYFCGAAKSRLEARYDEAEESGAAASSASDGYDMELYERMEAWAETLDKPDVTYWLVDDMQDGWVIHRPFATECFRAAVFLWQLFEEMVTGLDERAAVERVDEERADAPKFCETCCGWEAASYNPVPESQMPEPPPADPYERVAREMRFMQEREPMNRMRFKRAETDDEVREYGRYMAAMTEGAFAFWLEKSDEYQTIHREDAHTREPCLSRRLLTIDAFLMDLQVGIIDLNDPENVKHIRAHHYCQVCCLPERVRAWPEFNNGQLYSTALADPSHDVSIWADRGELMDRTVRIEQRMAVSS